MKTYNIFTDETKIENEKIWAACGSDELYPIIFSEEGEFLLKRMQKYKTCRFARNHYALSKEMNGNLRCGGDVYSEDENGNPLYDFSYINEVYRKLLSYGIKPIVELDFLPDALSLKDKTIEQEGTGEQLLNHSYPNDWEKWARLLTAFMQNLAETFGIEEIRTWYFEVWNEPDNWPVDTWDMFFKLYDVFVDCVTKTDDKLRVGGPGCFRQHFMYAFLDHIANGKNYITGQKGTRIDFLSYHIYGMSGGWLDEYPLIMPSVQRFSQELAWIERMIDKYPELREKDFLLDEWGVVSNYERSIKDYPPLEIRNSEYSALFMVKLMDVLVEHKIKYGLNIKTALFWGFANEDFFGKLFNGNRSLTTRCNICKPIQTAFELLSLLGDEFVRTDNIAGADEGVVATVSKNSAQALIYFFNEFDAMRKLPKRKYRINFSGLDDGCYTLKVYPLDDKHNNTYRIWQSLGSPEQPDVEELKKITKPQNGITPAFSKDIKVRNGKFVFKTSLSSISLKLIELIKK